VKLIYLVLNWVFGILFLLVGLVSIIETFLVAICFLVISALLIPPIKNFIQLKINKEILTKTKIISIFILLIISGVFISQYQDKKELKILEKQKQEKIDYFNSNRQEIISLIKEMFVTKSYKAVVSESNKYLVLGDQEIKQINSKAKNKLKDIQKIEKTKNFLAELKSVPAKEYEKNKNLYQQLSDMHPNDEKYKSKLKFYTAKINEEKEKGKVVAERKKKIELQFNPWDGSHRNLERVIKKAMNDPDSYEHVETMYGDRGDHLIVKTTYRGKNVFGGVVKNFVKAKVSLSGEILQILDES